MARPSENTQADADAARIAAEKEAAEKAAAEKAATEKAAAEKAAGEKAAAEKAAQERVQTVKMVMVDAPKGTPSTADVHPSEVENYVRHGWRRA